MASVSACVQRLYYCPLRTPLPDGDTGLLSESAKLLVGTMRAVAVVDTHTYEVLQAYYFKGGAPDVALLAR